MRIQAVITLLAAAVMNAQAVVTMPAITPRYAGAEIGEWTMDHTEALAKAQAGTNNVIVMFNGAWWCPHCQALERTVLTNEAWQAFVETNRMYLVMLDNPARNDGYWCWLRETNFYENAGLTREQAEAVITNQYALQTSYAVPGAATQTVNGLSYQRVGYPTLIVLRPDGTRLGRFSPLTTTASLDMVVRNVEQLLAADGGDEADNYYQGATLLPTPACEDEEADVGERSLSEPDASDWYAFDAAAGAQWSFVLRAAGAGVTNGVKVQILANPTNAVSAAERVMEPSELSVLSYVIPQSGRYWLRLSRASNLREVQGYRLAYWYGSPSATVRFSRPSVSASERMPSVVLTVDITDASFDSEVRVGYETVAGSALPGLDYAHTVGELVWGPGVKRAKTLTIPLLPDAVWEGDETFGVSLFAVRNCAVGETLSTCTVVLKEQLTRQPGRLGFESVAAAVVVEGSNAVFHAARTAGADGSVTARIEHVQGALRTPVAQLVWGHAETGAKAFGFAFTNEPGYQPDRQSALLLTPLGGASAVSSTGVRVSLTRRDDLVVQTLAEYAADPAHAAFGLRATRGVWFCGFCSDGERDEAWLRSCVVHVREAASLRSQLTGPGVLGFDWRLDGDGATLQCLVGGKAVAAITNTGLRAGAAVAVPAGRQTVEWVVRREGPEDVSAAVKSLAWTPLPQAAGPSPADKAAVIDRAVTLSWQDVFAGQAYPHGVTAQYEVYAGVTGAALSLLSLQAEPGFPRDGHAEDQALLSDLIVKAASKPLYWRVDAVGTDPLGRRAVHVGKTWSLSVLPAGSPEFVASEGGIDPTVAGGVTLPVQTVGVYGESGPFAVANAETGTVSVTVRNGSLPGGVGVQVRGGAIWIAGVPQRVSQGAADLHVAVTRRVGTRTVTAPGTSVTVVWAVQALGRAAGQFNGHLVTEEGAPGYGDASVTVTSAGRLSGRLMSEGLVYSFSAPAFEGQTDAHYFANAVAKAGTNAMAVALALAKDGSAAEMRLGAADSGAYELRRNNWGDAAGAALLRAYLGYYTVALPVRSKGVPNAPAGTGYLTLTVRAGGAVSYAGQMADGKNVSGSAVLQYGPDCCSAEDRVTFYLLGKPSGYGIGGGVYGLVYLAPGEAGEYDGAAETTVSAGDPSGLRWVNPDKKSVFGYNPTTGDLPDGIAGFTNVLDVTGGHYDKTINLHAFYGGAVLRIGSLFEAPADFDGMQGASGYGLASVPDQARLPVTVSSGGTLMFPRSVLVKTGTLIDFDASVNPWAMTVGASRTTGLFTGAFTCYYQGVDGAGRTQQKSRVFALRGVFLPVRAGDQSDADWAGFYLVPDRCRYLSPAGAQQSYPFNWSVGFSMAPGQGAD